MPTVRIITETKLSRKSSKLLKMLNDKNVRRNVNQMIGDAIQPYVPMKSGRLRRSMYVGVTLVSWGQKLPYARYQFGGVVYGPNYPGIYNGANAWRSPKGKGSKHPTGRELGVSGAALLTPIWEYGADDDGNYSYKRPESNMPRLYKFGYTTKGTQHHWTSVYQWKLKSDTNKKITKYLKDECKARGFNV